MALESFDILRFVANGHVQTEAMVNIFTFRALVTNDPPTYEEIMEGFLLNVLTPIQAYMSEDAGWDTYLLENSTNGEDIFAFGQPIVGTAESPMATPFLAYGIRLNRFNKVTRNGYKRIGGLTEAVIEDGRVNLPQVDIDIIQAALGEPFTVDGTSGSVQMVPVIVGKNPDGTLDLTRVNPIVSASLMSQITTQNTRKFHSSG